MSGEKRFTPSVSLTAAERQWLKMKAKEAGISYTRYMKEVALCKRTQDGKKIGKDYRLKKLLTENKNIGTNINQIAKVANETGIVNMDRFVEAKSELADLNLKILEELQ